MLSGLYQVLNKQVPLRTMQYQYQWSKYQYKYQYVTSKYQYQYQYQYLTFKYQYQYKYTVHKLSALSYTLQLHKVKVVVSYILKQDADLSQRNRAARCVLVFAKSRRLELGDNILRT